MRLKFTFPAKQNAVSVLRLCGLNEIGKVLSLQRTKVKEILKTSLLKRTEYTRNQQTIEEKTIIVSRHNAIKRR